MGYERVGERLRERMLARGYRKEDGEPDVQRFCWDWRFTTQLVYNWLNDRGTPFKDLIRLCAALDCSAEWLLTGAERPKASPRQGRGKIKGLLLALGVGLGAMLSPNAGLLGIMSVRARRQELARAV
jgi:hypothetical protein